MESLKAHTLRIESGAVNLNCVQDVCGVKEQPLFDAILTIGKGNEVLERKRSFGELNKGTTSCGRSIFG
jgi:hypothetical protein